MRRAYLSSTAIVMLALVLAAGTDATAEITLSTDFECGSLGGGSVIDNGTHTVVLDPRTMTVPETPDVDGKYWWTYFRVDGLPANEEVTFKLPSATFVNSYYQPANYGELRYVYSYDQVNWQFFTNGSVNLALDPTSYTFNANFGTQGSVYVAQSFPYTAQRASAHTAAVKLSPYVSPTLSGSPDLVVGTTVGGTNFSGRTIPQGSLYGYRITDSTVQTPKQKVVLLGGNHSGEMTGNFALEGLIYFLISDAPEAVSLRQKAEIYVYPMADPDGRTGGYTRSNQTNPTLDHNRHWNDNSFPDVVSLRAAMQADTGGDVDWFLDFHSFPVTVPSLYFDASPGASGPSDFIIALAALQPFLSPIPPSPDESNPGHADIWSTLGTGLNAENAYTLESGYVPDAPAEYYMLFGQDVGISLNEVIPEPASLSLLALGGLTLLRRKRR